MSTRVVLRYDANGVLSGLHEGSKKVLKVRRPQDRERLANRIGFSEATMSDHPKQEHILEYLKSIAQLHRAQFIERSKHEWKIVFMTLITYTLLVAATHSQSLHFPNTLAFLILGTAFIVGLALVSIFYLLFIHRANNKNKTIAEKAEHAMQTRINIDGLTEKIELFDLKDSQHWPWHTRTGKRGTWGFIGQTLAIVLFAATAILVFTLRYMKEAFKPMTDVAWMTLALVVVTAVYVVLIFRQTRQFKKILRYQLESDVTQLRIKKAELMLMDKSKKESKDWQEAKRILCDRLKQYNKTVKNS